MTDTRSRTTRWVSCDRYANAVVSTTRHLLSTTKGALTTFCGATASTPDTWVPNTRKAKCPVCVRKAAES